jgi:hypothetical protein
MSGSPIKTFLGWCLMAAGGLIAISAGLCTAWVVISTAGSGAGATAALAAVSLLFSALPIAIGVGLFVVGRDLSRRPARKPEG